LPKKGFPVVFHGVRSNQERTKSSPSYFNVLEASIIRNYCVKLVSDRERKICELKPVFSSTTLFLFSN
jgi:helicase MOV-10